MSKLTDESIYNSIKKYQHSNPARYNRYTKRYDAACTFRKDKKAAAMVLLAYDIYMDNV